MHPHSLQLVEVQEVQTPTGVDYKFHMNQETKKILLRDNNKGTLVCPVAICGKFRCGKSFLANLL
jgi:hypothetical protein